MLITYTSKLTAKDEAAVRELERRCAEAEGLTNKLFLSEEINFDTKFPCFYLASENERLIGFLLIFIPEAADAEVSALVDPDYRRRGVFQELLSSACKELAKIDNKRVLLLSEPQANSAAECAKAMNVTKLDRIEYTMQLTKCDFCPESCPLTFEEVTNENAALFTRVSREVYDEPEADDDRYTQAILSEPTRSGFIAYLKGEPVGVFSIKYEEVAYIYGVGIKSAFRSRGLGGSMIKYAAHTALKQRAQVNLDVDSSNPAALAMYKHCGFTTFCELRYFIYSDTEKTDSNK